jgi:hypothetical protein
MGGCLDGLLLSRPFAYLFGNFRGYSGISAGRWQIPAIDK